MKRLEEEQAERNIKFLNKTYDLMEDYKELGKELEDEQNGLWAASRFVSKKLKECPPFEHSCHWNKKCKCDVCWYIYFKGMVD